MSGSLRAIWRTITWRKLLVLQLVGQLACFLDAREEQPFGSWMGHPSAHFVAMALSVFLVVPIALLSDEAVKRGASARVAYAVAVLSMLPVALITYTFTQFVYVLIFGLPADRPNTFWAAGIESSFHMSIYSAFGMLIYVNQCTANRMLENFRNSELRRVELGRQLVESRLATAEAQIDPALLFKQLEEIKMGLARNDEGAEEQLSQLILSLRTALTRTLKAHEPSAEAAP